MAGRCAPGYTNKTPNAANATCVKSPTPSPIGGIVGASAGVSGGIKIPAVSTNPRVPGSTPSCAANKVAFYIKYYSGSDAGYHNINGIMVGYSDSMGKMAKAMKDCNHCATVDCENLAKLVAKKYIGANNAQVTTQPKGAAQNFSEGVGNTFQGLGNQFSAGGLSFGNFFNDIAKSFGQSASAVGQGLGQQVQLQALLPYIIIGGVALAALAILFKK